MAKDIEDFLRRAAERRQQQLAQQQQQAPPPAPEPPRQSRPQRQEPVIIDDIEIVEDRRPRDMRQQSVEQHVATHLDTSDIAVHAESLGNRIHAVSDSVDARIHENLDRDLSKIDDLPTVTDDPSVPIFGAKSNLAAMNFRKMLSDPNEVGKAIFLSEILKRPDWD